jgi:hypothetical protein
VSPLETIPRLASPIACEAIDKRMGSHWRTAGLRSLCGIAQWLARPYLSGLGPVALASLLGAVRLMLPTVSNGQTVAHDTTLRLIQVRARLLLRLAALLPAPWLANTVPSYPFDGR